MMASTVTRPERDYQGVFSEETEFIVDGGCTDHFVTKLGYFVPGTYVPCGAGDSMTIQTPNGFATAIGHGSVRYRHSSTGQIEVLHAWFAPTFPVNLLSQNKYARDCGYRYYVDPLNLFAAFLECEDRQSSYGDVVEFTGRVTAACTFRRDHNIVHMKGELLLSGNSTASPDSVYAGIAGHALAARFTNSTISKSGHGEVRRSVCEWHAVFGCASAHKLQKTSTSVYGMVITRGLNPKKHCTVCPCAGMTKTQTRARAVPLPIITDTTAIRSRPLTAKNLAHHVGAIQTVPIPSDMITQNPLPNIPSVDVDTLYALLSCSKRNTKSGHNDTCSTSATATTRRVVTTSRPVDVLPTPRDAVKKDARGVRRLTRLQVDKRAENFKTQSHNAIRNLDLMNAVPTDLPNDLEAYRTIGAGSVIFVDFIGPIHPIGLNGEKFGITIIDIFARHKVTECFTNKDLATPWFAQWYYRMRKHGNTVVLMICDVDTVFVSGEWKRFCDKVSIRIQPINPESQWQNLAEPTQRWLKRGSRALLIRSGFSKEFWPFAYKMQTFISNRLYVDRIGCTPYELWNFRSGPPDVRYMRIFGQWALVLKRNNRLSADGAFTEVCKLARFVAYGDNGHGYKFIDGDHGIPFISQHIVWLSKSDVGLYTPADVQSMLWDDVQERMLATGALFGDNDELKIYGNNLPLPASDPDLSMRLPPLTIANNPVRHVRNIKDKAQKTEERAAAKERAVLSKETVDRVIALASADLDVQDKIISTTLNSNIAECKLKDLQNTRDMLVADSIADSIGKAISVVQRPYEDDEKEPCEEKKRKPITYRPPAKWMLLDDSPVDPYDDDYNNMAMHASMPLAKGVFLPDGFDPMAKPIEAKKAVEDAIDFGPAKNAEYNSHQKKGTYELVQIPTDGSKVLKTRWVLTTKYKNGVFERYKARWVVCGYVQIEGVDFDETYAPVAATKSWKLFFAICAKRRFKMVLIDISVAFLNADVDHDIYVRQPPGFEKWGPDGEELVCKLLKALYGLRQSPMLWYRFLRNFLVVEAGLTQCEHDLCVFTKFDAKGELVMLLNIHADDLAFGFDETSPDALAILQKTRGKFDHTEEKLTFLLGMGVKTLDDGTILVDQRAYINKILERFKMEDVNATLIPMDDKLKFSINMPITKANKHIDVPTFQYLPKVGCLSYLATGTRPDLSFAYHNLSRFSQKTNKAHCLALKRVFRYLKGTKDFALRFEPDNDMVLVGHADADFGNDVDTSRSHTGYFLTLGNSPIFWKTVLQRLVPLSTTEAEVQAAKECVQEIIWMRGFLKELGYQQEDCTVLKEDNQGAIKISEGPKSTQRQRHYIIKCRWLQQRYHLGYYRMEYTRTHNQLADMLTKALGKVKFWEAVPKLLFDTLKNTWAHGVNKN